MNYGMRFMTLYRRQRSRIPNGKEIKIAKWLSGEAFQIAVKRREVKSKGDPVEPSISWSFRPFRPEGHILKKAGRLVSPFCQ